MLTMNDETDELGYAQTGKLGSDKNVSNTEDEIVDKVVDKNVLIVSPADDRVHGEAIGSTIASETSDGDLIITIPDAILNRMGWGEGTRVSVSVEDGVLVLRDAGDDDTIDDTEDTVENNDDNTVGNGDDAR